MNLSIDSLDENSFLEKTKNIYSYFPLIYWKLNNYKKLNVVPNEDILKLYFIRLINQDFEDLYQVNDVVSKALLESFSKNEINLAYPFLLTENIDYKELKIEKFLLEFSKLFFSYNFSTRKFIRTRINYLKNNLNKVKSKNNNKIVEGALFSHDGWWNNYYGPLKDEDTKNAFNTLFKNKKYLNELKADNVISYYKFFITLSYRLVEEGNLIRARKILIKKSRTIKRDFLIFYKSEVPYASNTITKSILSFLLNYELVQRHKTNYLMLLYRIENNKLTKKKLMKKILKINGLGKSVSSRIIRNIVMKNNINPLMMLGRPQHNLKIIEVLIDLYQLSEDSERKEIIVKINYYFIEVFKAIVSNYYIKYKEKFLNYFVITETFFIIFYYMEKILGINIQEY